MEQMIKMLLDSYGLEELLEENDITEEVVVEILKLYLNNESESVLVSIFVNPLQFEKQDDLAKYPKSLDADLKLAEAAGATAVSAPSYKDVYPGEIRKIDAGAIGNLYEGQSRAGHFSGVLTVVKRLFDLTNPKIAIFGEKDFQQLFLS